ncbi:hypothetical protein TVAG_484240 [Trichomonas vaginalis G3]|uniref:Uncharacterized protein n=1 Tax=Trichomonas vaginalis (strain ATCC PRA-98 / G3) TaxID=412133 RepID=A2GP23_TRIV3|nr:hypothetical protein TVAGG3_0422530 [Trichomonas vaginalis G3]EAX81092.1 hypothetical protein TVAG_484240 [Trichomonas vaginalis G3]KAI5536169.1 hypothetical protein TVAGG3_0422530 [Trichomonas vaginalis G3]|eukprot:XP_001294022.1 hypothetical protein [Trichomonas vaginalis G3]
MTDVPLPECLPKPEEPTAPAPQQTKTKTLTFFKLDFLQFELCLRRYEF